jgi:hypothetical protein
VGAVVSIERVTRLMRLLRPHILCTAPVPAREGISEPQRLRARHHAGGGDRQAE